MSDKNDTNHHYGVLLEDINHKFDAILEGQQSLVPIAQDVAQLKDDMVGVKTDVKVIKLAVRHQADDHGNLVKRVAERWNRRSDD